MEQLAPLPIRRLPLVGYLHTSLAETMQEVLLNVGHLRPKYPFMSPQLSAALYMGYYLCAKVKPQACLTNTCDEQGDRPCITNTFDAQFRQFLARISTVRDLAERLPWDYNPFLINQWIREERTDQAFQRIFKTRAELRKVLEKLPD